MTYDKIADALYIKLKNDKIQESEEISPGVIVDYNYDGEIVGIEILWFSKRNIDWKRIITEGPETLVTST